jgi:hypothetical protein
VPGSCRAPLPEDFLYDVDLKRLQFEHKGRTIETFVPVYRAKGRRLKGS